MMLIVAAIPMISLLWYATIFKSQMSEERILKAELQATVDKIKSLEQRLNRAGEIAGELRRAESDWDRFAGSLVSADSADIILDRVSAVAESHSLTVHARYLDFDPLIKKVGTDRHRSYTDKVIMEVEGQGRFFDIGDFIDALEEDLVVAGVDRVSVIYQTTTDPEVYFSVLAQVFVLCAEVDKS
jgi:hypothetical protein